MKKEEVKKLAQFFAELNNEETPAMMVMAKRKGSDDVDLYVCGTDDDRADMARIGLKIFTDVIGAVGMEGTTNAEQVEKQKEGRRKLGDDVIYTVDAHFKTIVPIDGEFYTRPELCKAIGLDERDGLHFMPAGEKHTFVSSTIKGGKELNERAMRAIEAVTKQNGEKAESPEIYGDAILVRNERINYAIINATV